MKLKRLLSQSSRQKNENGKGNCENMQTFSGIPQKPPMPSGEELFLQPKQYCLDKGKQMKSSGKGQSVS